MNLSIRIEQLKTDFPDAELIANEALDEITLEIPCVKLLATLIKLKNDPTYHFEQLVDLCGVDYAQYGMTEWATESTTATGFSRGVEAKTPSGITEWIKPRFAVTYHLLSLQHNERIRLRTFPEGEPPRLMSVISLWPGANWFEREVFDLFGIIFDDHPDLRRILTDYGFIGHPFRKDFPLIGNVEVRYDALAGRVIYEPVSIEPRTLVPKVIRDDNRYLTVEVSNSAKPGDK